MLLSLLQACTWRVMGQALVPAYVLVSPQGGGEDWDLAPIGRALEIAGRTKDSTGESRAQVRGRCPQGSVGAAHSVSACSRDGAGRWAREPCSLHSEAGAGTRLHKLVCLLLVSFPPVIHLVKAPDSADLITLQGRCWAAQALGLWLRLNAPACPGQQSPSARRETQASLGQPGATGHIHPSEPTSAPSSPPCCPHVARCGGHSGWGLSFSSPLGLRKSGKTR